MSTPILTRPYTPDSTHAIRLWQDTAFTVLAASVASGSTLLRHALAPLLARLRRWWSADVAVAAARGFVATAAAAVRARLAASPAAASARRWWSTSRAAAGVRAIARTRHGRLALNGAAVAAVAGLTLGAAAPASAEPVAVGTPMGLQSVTLAAASGAAPDTAQRETWTTQMFDLVGYPMADGTYMSSTFGPREAPCAVCSSMHLGVDWAPPAGTPIYAMADGVVSSAAYDSGYGYRVYIKHNIDGEKVTTISAHMLEGSMTVRTGDKVKQGEVIGEVGSTGHSTGPHLHFSLIKNGKHIDPLAFLERKANV